MKSLGLLVCLSMLLFSGCTALTNAEATYETIAADPHRNTARAKRLTSEAIDKIQKANWPKAEEKLQEVLVADVKYGPAHNNLGWVYFEQERYYLAAWEFEYASRLMPNAPEPVSNLGLVLEAVNRIPEAISNYEMARSMDPENPELLANLARARLRMGEKNFETAHLVREVILRDDRPEWREWAEEQLVVFHDGVLLATLLDVAPESEESSHDDQPNEADPTPIPPRPDPPLVPMPEILDLRPELPTVQPSHSFGPTHRGEG